MNQKMIPFNTNTGVRCTKSERGLACYKKQMILDSAVMKVNEPSMYIGKHANIGNVKYENLM